MSHFACGCRKQILLQGCSLLIPARRAPPVLKTQKSAVFVFFFAEKTYDISPPVTRKPTTRVLSSPPSTNTTPSGRHSDGQQNPSAHASQAPKGHGREAGPPRAQNLCTLGWCYLLLGAHSQERHGGYNEPPHVGRWPPRKRARRQERRTRFRKVNKAHFRFASLRFVSPPTLRISLLPSRRLS